MVGLAVGADTGAPQWIRTAGRGRDLAALGDPAVVPALAAVLRGAPGGAVNDDHLRRLLGVRSLASIRISRADAGVHGVALLGWLTDAPPTPDAMQTADTLIAHLGVALDNQEAMADIEAAQRGVVNRLQEAVRPPTPAVPHTELGVYYRAADEQGSTGGDLYDWIMLPDGNLHLAVVDVMGKGVAATKDAVAVTHALRLLVLDGCPLERVIARADALVTAHNPGLVATLVLGRYSPGTGQLRLVGGGHPPVMVDSAGNVRQVDVGGIPIGFPGAGSDREVTISARPGRHRGVLHRWLDRDNQGHHQGTRRPGWPHQLHQRLSGLPAGPSPGRSRSGRRCPQGRFAGPGFASTVAANRRRPSPGGSVRVSLHPNHRRRHAGPTLPRGLVGSSAG